MIFHNGQNRFLPNTAACSSFGGMYVRGSYLSHLTINLSHLTSDNHSHSFDQTPGEDERDELSTCNGRVDNQGSEERTGRCSLCVGAGITIAHSQSLKQGNLYQCGERMRSTYDMTGRSPNGQNQRTTISKRSKTNFARLGMPKTQSMTLLSDILVLDRCTEERVKSRIKVNDEY